MEEDKVQTDSEEGPEPTDMEIDSEDSAETDPEHAILEDAKAKRAERRKVVLKELEVCDLLDL